MDLRYYIAKIRCKLHQNNYEIMNEYYRKCGAKLGGVCLCVLTLAGLRHVLFR